MIRKIINRLTGNSLNYVYILTVDTFIWGVFSSREAAEKAYNRWIKQLNDLSGPEYRNPHIDAWLVNYRTNEKFIDYYEPKKNTKTSGNGYHPTTVAANTAIKNADHIS